MLAGPVKMCPCCVDLLPLPLLVTPRAARTDGDEESSLGSPEFEFEAYLSLTATVLLESLIGLLRVAGEWHPNQVPW